MNNESSTKLLFNGRLMEIIFFSLKKARESWSNIFVPIDRHHWVTFTGVHPPPPACQRVRKVKVSRKMAAILLRSPPNWCRWCAITAVYTLLSMRIIHFVFVGIASFRHSSGPGVWNFEVFNDATCNVAWWQCTALRAYIAYVYVHTFVSSMINTQCCHVQRGISWIHSGV